GISDKVKMSTFGVGECGMLALRHPSTCWTALFHIDYSTHPDQIAAAIAAYERAHPNAVLTASLYGLKTQNTPSNASKARNNLIHILEFMYPRKIDLTDADILSPSGASSFTINPKTGKLTESIGLKNLTNTSLKLALLYLGTQSNELSLAFDLTSSQEVQPIGYSSTAIQKMVHIDQKYTLEGRFKKNMAIDGSEKAALMYEIHIQRALTANREASLNMMKQLNHQLTGNSHYSNPIFYNTLVQLVHMGSKYVGEGAENANEQKVNHMASVVRSSPNAKKIISYLGKYIT
ncbi:MAG: hypothetical protein AB7E52_08590, partial [Bdellovibrionales bacterium]